MTIKELKSFVCRYGQYLNKNQPTFCLCPADFDNLWDQSHNSPYFHKSSNDKWNLIFVYEGCEFLIHRDEEICPDKIGVFFEITL